MSYRTTWRVGLYSMPETDPRYLDATDETIVRDLVIHAERARLERIENTDPTTLLAEDDPDSAGRLIDEMPEVTLDGR